MTGVAAVSGFGDQNDVETTLRPYSSDDEITLEDNQAIYLFELRDAPEGNSAFDLQDAVVLVTFTSGSGEPEIVERDGEFHVVCPA